MIGSTKFGPGRALAIAACFALLASYAPSIASADQPFQSVSPIALLLMDTSGSMEYDEAGYTGETNDEDVLAVPVCDPATGTYGKSRFIVATEVLSGSFAGYSCTYDDRSFPHNREDYGYVVPHVVPSGTQIDNGLIDVTGRRFKFGLMTFDTVASPGQGAGGGFSYGGENPINYGARNESAPTGRFVRPSSSEDEDDIRLRNYEVEAALLTSVPYGGTPIAPMLRDALYYFDNDPDLQPYDAANDTGDMFYPCRSKNIILISDGRANLGENLDGYSSAVNYAQQLLQAGVKVYVIGFQLPSGVDSLMDQIAASGGTTEAFIATDQTELAAVISYILGNMESTIQSRTRVVVTDDTGNTTDRQYQFNAAFGLVCGVPGIRQGYLERSVYTCSSGNMSSLSEVQSLSDKLSATPDSQRTIWTAIDDDLVEFDSSNSSLTTAHFDIPEPDNAGEVDLMDFSPTSDGVCGTSVLGDAYDEAIREEFKDNIIDFIRATDDSCRSGYKMGAVMHSTPAIQGHLKNIDVMIPSFKTFKNSDVFQNKPTMLYVGTHDGMMHAFKIDRPDTGIHASWGRELWAFIPNKILRKLKDLPTDHGVLMDGEPVVRDILLSRTPTSLANPSEEANNWRSVLISGYGKGGRGYFALDVTDPTDPQFMWEISNDGRCAAGDVSCPNSTGFGNDFSRLGYAVSRPAIGTAYLGSEEVAVAVFGGGFGGNLGGNAGKTVFVVRLDTGEKLEEFHADTNPNNVEDDCSKKGAGSEPLAHMIGDVTCYSTFPGTFVTRCFLGDSAGRLWRVELGSQCTANWRLQYFYDPYFSVPSTPPLGSPVRAPVVSAPGVAVKPFINELNELVVVYGAGDTVAIEGFEKKTFVASLTETDDPDADCPPYKESSCRLNGFTASLNWKVFLGHDEKLDRVTYDDANFGEELRGEKLMGAPVVFSNVAYFVTFAPDVANACNPGVGWVWGVDYFRNDNDCMVPVGKLDLDNSAETTDDIVKKVRIGGDAGSSIPFGLTVARRPFCFDGLNADDAIPPSQCADCNSLASMGSPNPSIIVQTAVQSAASADTIPAGSNSPPSVAKMTRDVLTMIHSLFVGAWGFVFD